MKYSLSLFVFFSFLLIGCDKCKDVDCGEGGTCVEGVCECSDGYSGENCENYDPCWDVTCQNGGECVDGTCECPGGYSGPECEVFDPCWDVTCLNQGTCVDGTCDCALGFEGDSCQTTLTSTWAGGYSGTIDCALPVPYNITLSDTTDALIFYIEEESGIEYKAELLTETTFNIPAQTVNNPVLGSFEVEGDGSFSGSDITVNVTKKAPINRNCVIEATKD